MNDASRALALKSGPGQVVVGPMPAMEFIYEPVEREEARSTVDVAALLAALRRNKYLIASVLFLSVAAALAASFFTAPRYRAVASVQIDQQTAKILESQDVEPITPPQEGDRFLQTQVDVLKSRSLSERVASSLRLDKNEKFRLGIGSDKVGSAALSLNTPTGRELILENLQENLSIELPKNSRIVRIVFESGDPELAKVIANSYAENFIVGNLQRRYDTSSYSRDFLQGQLAEAKRRLENSERQLISYARAAGLIDASTGISGSTDISGPKSLTTSNLVQLNQAYSQARSQRVQAQQRWNQARSTAAMNLPEVLSNPTVQQLTQSRAELEAQYQDERQRRKEEHPAVLQLAARIRELDQQIATISGSIKNSIRDQFEVAAAQEKALEGNVGQLRGETLAEQDRSVRYNILKREVDTSRQLYEGLLQRFREVSAEAGITSNNISIIDQAVTPLKPSWPRPALNAALGGAGGLMLAFLLVLVRERFDDSVHAPTDVEGKLNSTLLGVIPRIKDGDPVHALADPRSPMTEAYSSVKTAIELSSEGGLPKTLMLTSTKPGEGKSTTAYGLSHELAGSGKKVLLVDCDLRRPSLHRLLALQNEVGLSSILARSNDANEAVQNTAVTGLYFMASGPKPPNPAQLLGGGRLNQILRELSEIFDVIILDAPPVLGLADAPLLSKVAGGTIFIVEADGENRGRAKGALKRLLSVKADVLGVVLTKFDAKKHGYSDYGYDYYSYGNLESDASPVKHLGTAQR